MTFTALTTSTGTTNITITKKMYKFYKSNKMLINRKLVIRYYYYFDYITTIVIILL